MLGEARRCARRALERRKLLGVAEGEEGAIIWDGARQLPHGARGTWSFDGETIMSSNAVIRAD